MLNDLRDRIRLQTDGQLKTARDVCVAAALGAEEYAFSTGPLIALGCIMMRKCHLNTCPVGIATQDPELRKKFKGKPEHVINFFFLLAEEMRRTLQSLGMTSMDELVGAAGDVLEVDPAKLRSNGRPDKAMGLDLAPLLQSARELNPTAGYRHTQLQDHELGIKADNELMDAAHSLIETYAKGGEAEPIVIERETNNLDRTLGTMLSAKVSKACGKPGLPDDAVRIKLEGSSGQSLGFALAPEALGAFADAAEEEENEALCADCARRRDASDPPPFADAEPEEPEVGASSAAARARTPRPAGATARNRRAEDAAGRATRRPCTRVGQCARISKGRGSSASGDARRRCPPEPLG